MAMGAPTAELRRHDTGSLKGKVTLEINTQKKFQRSGHGHITPASDEKQVCDLEAKAKNKCEHSDRATVIVPGLVFLAGVVSYACQRNKGTERVHPNRYGLPREQANPPSNPTQSFGAR